MRTTAQSEGIIRTEIGVEMIIILLFIKATYHPAKERQVNVAILTFNQEVNSRFEIQRARYSKNNFSSSCGLNYTATLNIIFKMMN